MIGHRTPPDEARAIGQKGEPAGAAAVHVANGDCRLARALGVNQGGIRDLSAGRIADVISGLTRHVAGRAIVKLGRDDKLLVECAGRGNPLGRENPERLEPGRGRPIVAGSRADPAQQRLGLDRIPAEPLAAFVRDRAVGLRTIKLRSGSIRLKRRPDRSWVKA